MNTASYIIEEGNSKVRIFRFRVFIYTILFFLFLIPLVVNSISFNYSFILFPVGISLLTKKFNNPVKNISFFIFYCILIFIIAYIYQVDYYNLFLRRFVSLLLFLSMFVFSFIPITREMVTAFKYSILLASLFFIGGAIIGFIQMIDEIDIEQMKNAIGSNRYGFIYILAFWIVFFYIPGKPLYKLIKVGLLSILVFGLLLTFSRSSIVALAGSVVFFFLQIFINWIKKLTFKQILLGIAILALSIIFIIILLNKFPNLKTFYDERFAFMFDPVELKERLFNSKTSEGARIHIITTGVKYVVDNPVTGSGFLGIWILPEANAGSSHNQYLDILFRIGFAGFIIFFYLIARMLKVFARNEKPFYWGLIGILLFSLFNETFKESQGAFVFAFLIGLYSQYYREITLK